MKNLFFFISAIFFLCPVLSIAQSINDTAIPAKNDTTNKPSTTIRLNDSNKNSKTKDTRHALRKQIITPKPGNQEALILKDTTITPSSATSNETQSDTLATATALPVKNYININKLLQQNRFINVKDAPVYFIEEKRNPAGKEFLFYSLCGVALILGIFKTIYNGYFKNLFRVYFNTSLRQTQLADQLLQAKLPSFILNIFFTITGGIYIWLLFKQYHPPRLVNHNILLPFCIISVALIYFIKFCLIKFMGWVSDIKSTTDNYVFAIFMVNKIIGIFLLPVIILLAFLKPEWFTIVANISFMILGLFFLSRYVKSYGAVEKKLTITPFHFILYIVGAEIVPLLIIYKVATDYLI